jgi:hypothetical protein
MNFSFILTSLTSNSACWPALVIIILQRRRKLNGLQTSLGGGSVEATYTSQKKQSPDAV